MAKQGTSFPLTMALVALLSVTLHLQAQGMYCVPAYPRPRCVYCIGSLYYDTMLCAYKHILDHDDITDRWIVIGSVAVMQGGAPVQETSRPEQVTAVVANSTNLVCRKCSCCVVWGTGKNSLQTDCKFTCLQSHLD